MLRLTAILCAAMFMALLIGGRDMGQLRPGLAKAAAEAEQPPLAAAPAEIDVTALDVPQTARKPASASPVSVPAPVAAPDLPQPVAVAAPIPTAAPDAAPPTGLTAASYTDVAPQSTVWYVTAEAVNVREGPSTAFSVLGRVTLGEAMTLVEADDNGWARVRIEGDGVEGYVATRFLSQTAPGN